MKSIITLLLVAMTSIASAKELASYSYGIENLNDTWSTQFTKVTVTLNDDQELLVSKGNGGFDYHHKAVEVVTHKLSKAAYKLLLDQVIRLSQAEIEERRSDIVCMIAVSPAMSVNHLSVARDYDYKTQDFLGALKLVQGPTGCWVHHAIYPKRDYDRQTAAALKGQLRLLAAEILGDEL